jgi:predicted nucleic acid-binding protein
MSPFFDTNVVLYAVRPGDPRGERARLLLADGGIICVQALNEFTNVARRKLGQPWGEINEKLGAVRALCEVKPLTVATHERALALAERYGYQIYDALHLARSFDRVKGWHL